jgi:hypothetical protein
MATAKVQALAGGSKLVTLTAGKTKFTLLFYAGGELDGLGRVDVLIANREPPKKLKASERWVTASEEGVAALRAAAKLAAVDEDSSAADELKAALRRATGKVRFCRPGDAPWTTKKLPGVSIRTVGPAVDDQLARGFVARLTGSDDELAERLEPFEAEHRMDLEQLRAMATDAAHADMPLAAFFREHYFGAEPWRHIDQVWLDEAQALAPAAPLLEIELTPGGEVLRFP